MLNRPTTISELITQWKTVRDFADAIGCGYEAAAQMKKRNRIAPEHWENVIAAAANAGIEGINVHWLMTRYVRQARPAA